MGQVYLGSTKVSPLIIVKETSISNDIVGWATNLLADKNNRDTSIIFVLNNYIDTLSLEGVISTIPVGTRDNIWHFSDGATYTTRTSFTHSWDTSKDIQINVNTKYRYIIVETDDIQYSQYKIPFIESIVGLVSRNGLFIDNSFFRTTTPIEFIKYLNVSPLCSQYTIPYNGIFYYSSPLYLEGVDFTNYTSSIELNIRGRCIFKNFKGISQDFKVAVEGRCILSYESLQTIKNALLEVTTTKTITIGNSKSLYTTEDLDYITNLGWTIL